MTVSIDPASADPRQIGRMGELWIELQLVNQGWLVGNFNAGLNNSTGWDVFAAKPGCAAKIRVKSKRPGTDCFRWSAKADGAILLNFAPGDPQDFVAAVDFQTEGQHAVYILPAGVVEQALRVNHEAYIGGLKRDGTARKNGNQRNLHLDDDLSGRIGHGYRQHWAPYREAWHLLEELSPVVAV